MNFVRFNTESESPDDMCEECHDTGWGGDINPGIKGNYEVQPCDCDEQKRAIRVLKRKETK